MPIGRVAVPGGDAGGTPGVHGEETFGRVSGSVGRPATMGEECQSGDWRSQGGCRRDAGVHGEETFGRGQCGNERRLVEALVKLLFGGFL